MDSREKLLARIDELWEENTLLRDKIRELTDSAEDFAVTDSELDEQFEDS